MAERINRIGTDKYTITVNTAGEILLDTGFTGKVTINGDLDVLGDQTSIGSTELIVNDKTITINDGDLGDASGISNIGDYGRSSGIIINRGNSAFDALFFFDETLNTNLGSQSSPGAFVFKTANDDFRGIHTASITTATGQNLHLLDSNGLVLVPTNTDYEKQIWDYTGSNITPNPSEVDGLSAPVEGALVNTKGLLDYVKGYFTYNFQDKITTGSITPTSVQVYDSETGGGTSRVEIVSDNSIIATFFETRVEFEDLRFDDNIITSNGINSDIVLKGSGTGVVSLDGWQNFTVQADPASPPAEGTTLYSKTLADGGTGLFFINSDGTADELVSRNKALLYSIIF